MMEELTNGANSQDFINARTNTVMLNSIGDSETEDHHPILALQPSDLTGTPSKLHQIFDLLSSGGTSVFIGPRKAKPGSR